MNTDSNTGTMGDTGTGTSTEMNTTFANEAASGGIMEVELAKLAQQNALSAEVKAFAKMIEQDHTNANNELKSIASSKNMTLPTEMMSNHKKHMDDMKDLKRKEFDKHYLYRYDGR